ncbi:DUF4129 domain-containing protein [Parasediminibacterium paludis]|uniref:DUF4129 domain-containing protein n=1 Tax=Parasediminibacterium paludis TaxID=908966 RepID=A0ABV8PZX6_9BACT
MLDSSTVAIRPFNDSIYKNDSAFIYEEMPLQTETWWDRMWRKFWKFIDLLFSTKGGKQFFKWGLPAIALCVLGFFVYKFTGANKSGFFSKNGDTAFAYQIDEENIHELDFKTAIDKAIANANYRLAVRLLYLQTLKQLTDRGLIDWRINKTNAIYVQELAGNEQQTSFIQLTNYFDRVWYGETTITNEQFHDVQQSFIQFQQQIQS